jgi:hypothetical protein
MGVPVDPKDLRAAPRQFEAVKPRVAANVENPPTVQICRQMRSQLLPFPIRKITKMVVGEGLNRIGEVYVMKPRAQVLDVLEDTLLIHQVNSIQWF